MGGCASRDVPSDDEEEYEVPIQERWRHRNCTVHAPHQLTIRRKVTLRGDYCWVVKGITTKTLSMWKVWPEFLLHWTPQPFRKWQYRKVWFLHGYTWLLLSLLLLPLMWLHEGTWRLELHTLFEGLSDSDYQWPSGGPWRCDSYAPLMETWRHPDVLGVCFELDLMWISASKC